MDDAMSRLGRVYSRAAFVLFQAVAFTLGAALFPDILFRMGKRPVSQSVFFLLAGGLLWLLLGVIGLAKSAGPSEGGWTGGPDPEQDVRQRLNADVSMRDVAVIAGPLAVCAALALAISMLAEPTVNLMTTDTAGNVYIQSGERLLVSDPVGKTLADIDLRDAGIRVRGLTDMRAFDPAHIYLADSDAHAVHVLAAGAARARRIDLRGLRHFDAILPLAISEGRVLVLGADSVAECTDEGLRIVYADPELRFPAGLERGEGGTLFVADSDNERVLEVRDGRVSRTITMGDGFEDMAHPTETRVAQDGTLYVIARKHDAVTVPVYWRGLLSVARPGETVLRRVDLRWRGREMDVLQCSPLPDGRLLFAPLGYEALMIADGTGVAEKWAPGEMRARFRLMQAGSLLIAWGPALLVIAGVVIAMLGFAISFAKKGTPVPVVRPPVRASGIVGTSPAVATDDLGHDSFHV